MEGPTVCASEAFSRLVEGNRRFLEGRIPERSLKERMIETADRGQHPYAVIVTCSDSRVVPEFIFSTGIGDLFVIRGAGNTIDDCTLGSIEYAIAHLGCKLIVVLGHTSCGAVTAAVQGNREMHISNITDRIQSCLCGEKDIGCACRKNIVNTLRIVENDLPERHDVRYVGGIYDIREGTVEFFEDLHETE